MTDPTGPDTDGTPEELAVVAADSQAVELVDEPGLPPSQSRGFANAVRWNFAGTLLRVAMTFFSQMFILRVVGPAIAGQNTIFMVIVGIGSILSEGGMLAALMRTPEMSRPVLRNAIFLILVYAGAVTVALLLGLPLLIHVFGLTPAQFFIPLCATLNVLPLALSSVPMSVLKRNYRSKEIQIVQISAYFIGFLCVGLPIVLLRPSVWGLIIAFSLQTLTTLIALWVAARCPLLPLARGANAMRGASSKGMAANVTYFMNETVAHVMTAHFLGTFAVGLFGTALNLTRLPTDQLINTMHAPLMASTARNEVEAPARLIGTMNALAVVVLPTYVVASLCARSILPPLLGNKWLSIAPVFSIVVLAMLCRLVGMLNGAILWGKGALVADIAAQLVALGSFVLMFFLFRPQDGEHVALLVLAAWSARMVIQAAVATRLLAVPVSRLARSFLGPALVSMVFVLPLGWLNAYVGIRPTIAALLLLGVCGAVLLVLRLLVAIRWDGDDWARSLGERLPSSLRSRVLRSAPAVR